MGARHQYDTINFGKHKGKRWEEIPDSYLNWMIEKGDPEKAGTKIASDEMQMRADEGVSVPDDTETAPQAAKRESGAKKTSDLEARVKRLEDAVFKKTEVKNSPEPMSFDDDSIPF